VEPGIALTSDVARSARFAGGASTNAAIVSVLPADHAPRNASVSATGSGGGAVSRRTTNRTPATTAATTATMTTVRHPTNRRRRVANVRGIAHCARRGHRSTARPALGEDGTRSTTSNRAATGATKERKELAGLTSDLWGGHPAPQRGRTKQYVCGTE